MWRVERGGRWCGHLCGFGDCPGFKRGGKMKMFGEECEADGGICGIGW